MGIDLVLPVVVLDKPVQVQPSPPIKESMVMDIVNMAAYNVQTM